MDTENIVGDQHPSWITSDVVFEVLILEILGLKWVHNHRENVIYVCGYQGGVVE